MILDEASLKRIAAMNGVGIGYFLEAPWKRISVRDGWSVSWVTGRPPHAAMSTISQSAQLVRNFSVFYRNGTRLCRWAAYIRAPLANLSAYRP
jgi:hypothetical protein